MQSQVMQINRMLLSPDEEMRTLGRIVMANTISSKNSDKMHRVMLLLNSNMMAGINEGVRLFLTQEKSMKLLDKLILLSNTYGWNSGTLNGLTKIQDYYRKIKKLEGYFLGEPVEGRDWGGKLIIEIPKINYIQLDPTKQTKTSGLDDQIRYSSW